MSYWYNVLAKWSMQKGEGPHRGRIGLQEERGLFEPLLACFKVGHCGEIVEEGSPQRCYGGAYLKLLWSDYVFRSG